MAIEMHHIAIMAIGLTVISCTENQQASVTEGECTDVLASFSVVPTMDQDATARVEMLETIKASQEEKFAEACSRFPGWSEEFESAYRQAVQEAGTLTDDAAGAPVVKVDE